MTRRSRYGRRSRHKAGMSFMNSRLPLLSVPSPGLHGSMASSYWQDQPMAPFITFSGKAMTRGVRPLILDMMEVSIQLAGALPLTLPCSAMNISPLR